MYVNEYRQKLMTKLGLSLDVVKAHGNQMQLTSGRIVKDYLAQYGSLPFGHNPDFAVNALRNHLDERRPVFLQPTIHPDAIALATQLAQAVNEQYTRCAFTNSGAETVEAALKLARMRTGRKRVLSLRKGFHGKTFAALSASGSSRFKTSHIHDGDSHGYLEPEDFDGLQAELETGEYAAFVVEPVQGEGGMRMISPAFLLRAIELCEAHGTLSIFDEVQTGMGRLGDVCAARMYDMQPDMVLFSKALGAGLVPVGAVLYKEKAYTAEFDRKHSSTFANNGLAAKAGLAMLNQLLENDGARMRHVREMSKHVDAHIDALSDRYPGLFEAQGAGLMRGLQLHDAQALNNLTINFCQNSGALAYVVCGYLLHQHGMSTMPLMSQPCSIRFEPPLDVSKDDVDAFFTAFGEVCHLISQGRYDVLFAYLINKDIADLPSMTVRCPVSEAEHLSRPSHDLPGLIKGKKFAFLIHGTSAMDNIRSFPVAIHRHFNDAEQEALCQCIMEISAIDFGPEVALEFGVTSPHAHANGMFIFTPLGPDDMMALPEHEKLNLMKLYLDVARDNGVEVVGLGAYTSVISRGGESVLSLADGLVLTNGNSLTALATVESVRSMGTESAPGKTAVIIGARGSVGKVAVLGLAHNFGRIILVGRRGSEQAVLAEIFPRLVHLAMTTDEVIQKGSVLDKIKVWLKSQDSLNAVMDALRDGSHVQLGVLADSDYEAVLTQADCIVSATSEGKPFLRALSLKPDAVVFDTARPFDFHRGDHRHVFEGGLVQQPQSLNYGDCNMVGTPLGVNLACLSETIAVALERVETHQSIGKNITFQQAMSVLKIAHKHGFQPVQYGDVVREEVRHAA